MRLLEGASLSKILSQATERRGRCSVSTAICVIGTDGVQLATKFGQKGGGGGGGGYREKLRIKKYIYKFLNTLLYCLAHPH